MPAASQPLQPQAQNDWRSVNDAEEARNEIIMLAYGEIFDAMLSWLNRTLQEVQALSACYVTVSQVHMSRAEFAVGASFIRWIPPSWDRFTIAHPISYIHHMGALSSL